MGFSSDGKYLATACLDATLMIWNAQTYQLIHTFDGPSESLECLAWHSKGPVVVAGGGDGMKLIVSFLSTLDYKHIITLRHGVDVECRKGSKHERICWPFGSS